MKKFIICIITLISISILFIPAFAEDEPAQNMSAVRLMVTGFSVENDCIVPGKKSEISITIKNTNAYKSARNVKFTLTDPEKEIIPDGMGTVYVNYIDDEYVWKTALSAVYSASEGRHELLLTAEYEDKYYCSFSSSESLYVDIRQPVSFDYSGAALPAKIMQDETVTLSLTLMNTGKSALSNVKAEISADGLSSGGAVFAGEIPSGESKTVSLNVRAVKDTPGELTGEIKFSYEDCSGKAYSQTVQVSSDITEKLEIKAAEPEKKPADKIAWWLWILIGAVPSAAVAAVIPCAVYSAKMRRQDEMRL